MKKISVCIVTYNEEKNILDCLKSIEWADEIIIVDSFSTDKTMEICRKFTDKIFQRQWAGYIDQKNFALQQTRHRWVLFLDADERLSPMLAEEIQKEISSDPNRWSGFSFPRHVYYLGRWINHGGWYPDYKVRLFRKDKGYFGGEEPHDKAIIKGQIKRLKNDMWHFTYRDLSHHLQTINKFSTAAAEQQQTRGKKEKLLLFKLIFKPIVKFLENYILKRGFLDGWPGFVISVFTSFYIFMKYAKYWELRYKKSAQPR